MSNFLANLVSRSLAPAPHALQPKLPSLFEAPADGEPLLEESLTLNPRTEIAEEAPVSPIKNHPRSFSVMEDERDTDPQSESIRNPHERRRTILPFVPEEQTHVQNESRREEHVITTVVRAESKLIEREQAAGPRPEAVIPSIRENNKSESARERAPRLVPVIPGLESTHSIPQTETTTDAKMFLPEDRSPTVHIRIGRIEVRAATQASPPARPSTPQRPKMTLDDYLARRNEGKR